MLLEATIVLLVSPLIYKMLIVNRYPGNPEIAEINSAQKLVSILDETLNKNVPVLLFLSGGSWITALEKADYSALISNQCLKNLTIMTLDERVEIGPNNNFSKITSLPLIKFFLASGAKSITTLPVEREDPVIFGQKINQKIIAYLTLNPNAVLIACAGVGGEKNVPGHIAGIEPMEDKNLFSDYFQNPSILYRGYLARKLQPSPRATATFSLLNKVNHFILLVLNPQEKRRPLNLILSENKVDLSDFPCIYFRHHSNTTIYTDIPKQ